MKIQRCIVDNVLGVSVKLTMEEWICLQEMVAGLIGQTGWCQRSDDAKLVAIQIARGRTD